MTTLIFDTETNGLPKGNRQPALIQIAGKLIEYDKVIRAISFFVKLKCEDHPEWNFTIPEEKFFLDQGYTDSWVNRVGVKPKTAVMAFYNLLRQADRLVAHNMRFDFPVMLASLERLDLPTSRLLQTPKFCTMLTLTPILQLPGKRGYKWPRLDEAYKRLVNPDGFQGAHEALSDVTATQEVLKVIEQKCIKLVQV